MKRRIQLLLPVLLLFCSLPVIASAQLNVTAQQAAAWVESLVDAKWGTMENNPNYDGSEWLLPSQGDKGEPQCVDLTAAYLDYLGVARIGGNANDYVGKVLPEGLTYRDYYSLGDIAVWSDDAYGHVGVIYAIDASGFYYVDCRGDYECWYDENGYQHNTGAQRRGPKTTATTFIHPNFRTKPDNAVNLGDDFYATVIQDSSGGMLENNGTKIITGSNPSQSAYSNDPKRIWHFRKQQTGEHEGSYEIVCESNGKCIDVANWGTANGTGINLLNPSGNTAQRFYICSNNTAMYTRYYFQTVYCDSSLDIPGDYSSVGGTMQLWSTNNTAAQLFQINNLAYSEINYPGRQTPPVPTLAAYDNPDGVYLTWKSATTGSFDSRRYAVYVYPGNSASGTIVFGKPDTLWSNETVELPSGVYTMKVFAYNTKYEDLFSSATLTFSVAGSEYTINYDANGGTSAPAAQTESGIAELSSVIPTREGYRFLGWATSATAKAAEYQPGNTYSGGTITLFAVWDVITFTVTFDSDGAGSYDLRTVYYGAALGELPEPQKNGYLFSGWFAADGTEASAGTAVMSDLILTARWTDLTKMVLPASTTVIDDGAFDGVATSAFVIPEGVTAIGSLAFANNNRLSSVIIYSDKVTPAGNAFYNSPNVTIYGYEDTPVHYYATAKKIPFVPIAAPAQWVPYADVPVGATITGEKWTYTETAYSTDSVMSGWTLTGTDWQMIDNGISSFINFSSEAPGFSQDNALFAKYNPANRKTAVNEENRRVVLGDISNAGYVYYHWVLEDRWVTDAANAGRTINVYVWDRTGTDSDGYTYTRFNAFETSGILDPVTGRTNSNDYANLTGEGIYSTCYTDMQYNLPEYISYWWYIVGINQQPYSEYEKVNTFTRNSESETEVQPGNGISNVQHWAKYEF